jgi:hypothetical protein
LKLALPSKTEGVIHRNGGIERVEFRGALTFSD